MRSRGSRRRRNARSCGHSARLAAGLPRSSANGQETIKACVAGSPGLQPDARNKAICRRSGMPTRLRRCGAAAGAVFGARGASAGAAVARRATGVLTTADCGPRSTRAGAAISARSATSTGAGNASAASRSRYTVCPNACRYDTCRSDHIGSDGGSLTKTRSWQLWHAPPTSPQPHQRARQGIQHADHQKGARQVDHQ